MTLTEFLLARIAEDERDAQHPAGTLRMIQGRALAECEAKRRIVALHMPDTPYCSSGFRDDWEHADVLRPCGNLRALALPYADHPDYDESWRP